ncbi:MAG: hypothetical protein K0S78_5528, partial [Thermomicrobiales bacterium]|nr:hypothetical protein [Thermomicrobiales bacterium]
DELTDEEHIDTIVTIFLHGLRPEDPAGTGEEGQA